MCAGFVDGALNTNACPPGFSKIATAAACASAAGVLGRSYLGVTNTADWPSGCYGLSPKVNFNDYPAGAPKLGFFQLLCAGKPPLSTACAGKVRRRLNCSA